jgi:hypothetical protein
MKSTLLARFSIICFLFSDPTMEEVTRLKMIKKLKTILLIKINCCKRYGFVLYNR